MWNLISGRANPMQTRLFRTGKAFKESGLAYESQGALVVDVKEDNDTKEMPPCIILKSDGAALYATTDLATIVDRMENLHADSLIYLADKRQEMHFCTGVPCSEKGGVGNT